MIDAIGPAMLCATIERSGVRASSSSAIELAPGFKSVSFEDRKSTHASNPEHWESLSISLHNLDQLAARH
jgi:hypothetical protein